MAPSGSEKYPSSRVTDWIGRLNKREGSKLTSGFPGRACGIRGTPVTASGQLQRPCNVVKST